MFCSNEEELLRAAGGCQRTEPPMLQDGALGVVTSLPDQTSGTNSSNSSLPVVTRSPSCLPVATRSPSCLLWRRDFILSILQVEKLAATRKHLLPQKAGAGPFSLVPLSLPVVTRSPSCLFVATRFHRVSCGDEISILSLVATRFHLVDPAS